MWRLYTLVVIGVCAGGAFAEPASISVKAECVVSSEHFTLGEIASIEAPKELKDKLSVIALGMSPRPGLRRAFTRAQVETRLRQHGVDPKSLSIAMPNEIVVLRSSATVEPDRIIQTAKDELARQFPEVAARAVVQHPPRPLAVSPGEFTCAASQNIRRSGDTYTVAVTVEQSGRSAGLYNVAFRDERKAAQMLIKVNDPINLERIAGGLVITITGQARSAGVIDDTITVFLPGTRKLVKAIVVGERTARFVGE